MKKNLVRLLSVILAVVMVFPVSAFATDGSSKDIALWCGTDQDNTYSIASDVKLEDVTNFAMSGDGSINLDKDTGLVTAVSAGSVTLTAIHTDDTGTSILFVWNFNITKRSADSIAVTTPPTKTSYISGQTFDPTGMVITATCNNGEKLTVPLANCTFTPNPLDAGTSEVTITWGELTTTQAVTVDENAVTKVSIYSAPSEAYVGDRLTDLDIKVQVTWANGDTAIMENGWDAVPSGALTKDVKSFYVTFQNVKSESRNIKVIDKPTEGGGSGGGSGSGSGGETTTDDYVLTAVTTYLKKKTYSVGDTFETDGLSVQVTLKKTGTLVTNLAGSVGTTALLAQPYVFDTKDISPVTGTTRTTTITITVWYNNKPYSVPVSGLTVTAAKKTLDYQVSNHVIKEFAVSLVKDLYPVGTTLSLDDIYRISFKDSYGNQIYLSRSDLKDYSHTFSLEVCTVQSSSGTRDPSPSRKTSYKTRIEKYDVYTYLNNEEVVFLRLYIDDVDYYQFECPSGEGAVSVYTNSAFTSTSLIGTYSSLTSALDDVNDLKHQWSSSSTSTYNERQSLYIKLNQDASIEHYDYWIPARNITIDLNGHKLTMYTDTFRFRDKYDSYSVSFSNNASDPANIIYKDYTIAGKDATLLIDGKNETITFKFQEDSSVIPGIYTVTVAEIKEGGTVTASPALSNKNTVSIAHGNDVTFTITPAKDFGIDTVKIKKGASAESTVSTTTNSTVYSVNSNSGIATYTLKDVTVNCTLTATFKSTKKEETKPEEQKPAESTWVSPYSDVQSKTLSYYPAVEYVTKNGLMNGMTSTTFGPTQTMTRAQFVTTLGRMYLGAFYATTEEKDAAMLDRYGTNSKFTDVSATDPRISYAVPYIIWAEQNGLVLGIGNNKFAPYPTDENDPNAKGRITHQEMYIIMYRYAALVGQSINTRDVSNESLRAYDASQIGAGWKADAVESATMAAKYAQMKNFLVSTSRIAPAENATRSELAMLLMLFSQNVLGRK